MAISQDSTPVTVLTGFLGSGKTTLLRRALTAPELSDTAVVINEVGEIAIDHYLVDIVAGDVVELPGGCLCCAVREDLARTLRVLVERREAGEIRPFRRIVIETSGLADPGPILYTLSADPLLDQRLRLTRVIAVVDAVTGAATLENFAEAARQAAVADAIVVAKTDLAPFSEPLAGRLMALNPTARPVSAAHADPATLFFDPDLGTSLELEREDADRRSPSRAARAESDAAAVHTHGIATFTLVLERAITRFEFAHTLGELAMARGTDLLRVKGLVAFSDRPGRPAVIQVAQHAMFSPEWLDAWPDADRRSRLVFIVRDIPPEEILDRFAFAAPSIIGPVNAARSHSGRPNVESQTERFRRA